MNTTNDTQFEKFINTASSNKEASLIIAKDEDEIKKYAKRLQELNFKETKNCERLIDEFLKPAKIYLVLDQNFDKNCYDFIMQYPTGLIEMFDKNIMSSRTIHPDYKDLTFLLLSTKSNLIQIQKNKFDILSNVGLTYRSK